MEAKQFVYTNVEEKDSPHRRRGDQSWLFPQEYPAELRQQIEKLLNTFDRRPDTPVRFLSVGVGSEHLIARFQSLAGVDRFGRQGRYIAHALLLSKSDFRALNYDPFRVIDADGVEFLKDPADVIGRSDWPSIQAAKQLPALQFEPANEARPDAAVPADVVGWLFWLAKQKPGAPGTKAQFLAVVCPPAEVLAFARRAIRALPPAFREDVSFDTLRPPRSPHTPRLSGAVSADWLKRWTITKNYAEYEPGQAAAPDLPVVLPPWAEVVAAWADGPELADEDRTSSYEVAKWLFVAADDEPTPAATPAAVGVAAGWGGTAGAWAAKRARAVAAALGGFSDPWFEFLTPLADALLGVWSEGGLRALRDGVSASDVSQWLYQRLNEEPVAPPAEAQFQLANWLRQHPESVRARRLTLILNRWRMNLGALTATVNYLNRQPSDDPAWKWFHGWCRKTLPGDFADAHRLIDVADWVLKEADPRPEDLNALALAYAVHSTDPDLRANYPHELERAQVARVAHRHAPAETLGELRTDPETVAGWILDAFGPAWKATARYAAFYDDPDDPNPRYEAAGFPPGHPTQSALVWVGTEFACGARLPLAEYALRTTAGKEWLRREGILPLRLPVVSEPIYLPPSEADLKALGAAYMGKKREELTRLFRESHARFYEMAKKYLFENLYLDANCEVSFARTGSHRAYFAGLVPRVIGKDWHPRTLFRALIETVVPLRRVDDEAPPPEPDSRREELLLWLCGRIPRHRKPGEWFQPRPDDSGRPL